MWRILFLLLVVLGSLAMLLALVVGIGVARVSAGQEDSPPPPSDVVPARATEPDSPERPATSPATVPATQP